MIKIRFATLVRQCQSHRRGKFLGIGRKLKVRGLILARKNFCPTFPLGPHFSFGPCILTSDWSSSGLVFLSTRKICVAKFDFKMSKEYVGDSRNNCFSYLCNKIVYT